jgi:hypothetical protein
MPDVQLGGATYTPGTGEWSGGDIQQAADQLQPGDRGKLTVTFPFAINFVPGDAIAFVLGGVFSLNGLTLEGVDFDGDSTLVLVFRMGT